jgi:hypothetical protein
MQDVEMAVRALLQAQEAKNIDVYHSHLADIFMGQVREHNDLIIAVGNRATGAVTLLYVIVIRTHIETQLRQRYWELRLVIEMNGIIREQRSLYLSNHADNLYGWAPAVAQECVDAIVAADGAVELPRIYDALDALHIPRIRHAFRMERLHPSKPREVAEKALTKEGASRVRYRPL